jgi:hypothetical protein
VGGAVKQRSREAETAAQVAKGERAARATSAETPSGTVEGDPAQFWCGSTTAVYISGWHLQEKGQRERANSRRSALDSACLCCVVRSKEIGGIDRLCWEEETRSFELLSMVLNFCSRPAAGATGVAETMRTRSDVDYIFIRHDWFGDDDAEELAAALAGNTSLKQLFLIGCSIGARGLMSIGEALKVNNTLTVFILAGFMIGDAGAEIVADALVSNSSLEFLGLRDGGIGVVGLKAIAKALEINTSLKALCIDNNSKIGDAGALALADVLASSKSLEFLELKGCGIGEQGAMALGQALGTNLALGVTGFNIGHDGVREEAKRIRRLALERRDKLVAFGMSTIPRLGGIRAANAGPNTRSSSKVCVLRFMNKDVFRLIGEAYGDY